MKKGQTKAELTELLQRLQAEFENFRKRTEAQNCQMAASATQGLVEKLLPVLDHFELALKAEGDDCYKQGFEMIFAQLYSILEKEGLKEMPEKKHFNPELHEAVQAVESKKPKGTILEVFQKGYLFNDKVLRHARVKVAK